MRIQGLALAALLAAHGALACEPPLSDHTAVPTSVVAIDRAKRVWREVYEKASFNRAPWAWIYGDENVKAFEPYTATLSRNEWHVVGTAHGVSERGPEAFFCIRSGAGHVPSRGDQDVQVPAPPGDLAPAVRSR
jgi:hypothetical protein